jgi:hypothetical protein
VMCLLMPRREATAVPALADRARSGMRSTQRGSPQRCETAGDRMTVLYRDRVQATVTHITDSEELLRALTSQVQSVAADTSPAVASVATRSGERTVEWQSLDAFRQKRAE